MTSQSITLPAGTYYVGDPSAVFSREDWRELCRQTRDFTAGGPLFEFRGARMVVAPVRSGDGIYADSDDGVYSVGSGLIGITPQALSSVSPLEPCGSGGRWEDALQSLEVSVFTSQIVVNVDGTHSFSIALEETSAIGE